MGETISYIFHIEYVEQLVFCCVFGSLKGKILVVDDVLSSHEQRKCLTISMDEKCRVPISKVSNLSN